MPSPCLSGPVRGSPFVFPRNPKSKPSSRRGAGARRKVKILISREGAKTPRNPISNVFPLRLRGLARDPGLWFFRHQGLNQSSHGATEARGGSIQTAFLRVPAPPREDRLSPLTSRNPKSKPSSRRGAGARRKGKILISREGAKTPRNPISNVFPLRLRGLARDPGLGFCRHLGPKPVLSRGHGDTGKAYLQRVSSVSPWLRERIAFSLCPAETQSQNHPLAEAQGREGKAKA